MNKRTMYDPKAKWAYLRILVHIKRSWLIQFGLKTLKKYLLALSLLSGILFADCVYSAEIYTNGTIYIIRTDNSLSLMVINQDGTIQVSQLERMRTNGLPNPPVPNPPGPPNTLADKVRITVLSIQGTNKKEIAQGLAKVYEQAENLAGAANSAAQLRRGIDLLVDSVLSLSNAKNKWKSFLDLVDQETKSETDKNNLIKLYKEVEKGLKEASWTSRQLERIE